MTTPIEFDPARPELGPADQVLARTAWGENRSGGLCGMQSVINAVMNRATHPGWWGSSALTVCLMRNQFDCWGVGDPNRARLLAVTPADPQFATALTLARQALSAGGLADLTEGADSYYAASMPSAPYWVAGHPLLGVPPARFTKEIAGQKFFITR